eukprot:scaffold23709_cov86-Skeletonema_dohrnii-CCMP3373.AAC.6
MGGMKIATATHKHKNGKDNTGAGGIIATIQIQISITTLTKKWSQHLLLQAIDSTENQFGQCLNVNEDVDNSYIWQFFTKHKRNGRKAKGNAGFGGEGEELKKE